MRLDIRTAGLVVAAGAVLLLTVLGAAVGGSWQLEERSFDVLAPVAPEDVPPPPPAMRPLEATPPPAGATVDWTWLGFVAVLVQLALVALALWWLWSWLRRHLPTRRTALGDALPGPAQVDDPELPVLQRGVEEAQRHLAEVAGPSDAVIAAWLALEDAASASGVARAPSQTPTEFTVAVLEATAADPGATTELLALYHRARFSGRRVDAADVEAASRCLARLAQGWDAVAAAEGGRR